MDIEQIQGIWQRYKEGQRSNPRLGTILVNSEVKQYENGVLTVYVPDEESRQALESKQESIRGKLVKKFSLSCQLQFISRSTTIADLNALPSIENPAFGDRCNNPLQVLCHEQPVLPSVEEEAPRMEMLEASVEADRACQAVYDRLTQRTEELTENRGTTFTVSFPWRLRVGGTRGFRDLLFPAFHPVFGIPYIPASSLKGAALAWAKKNGQNEEAQRLFGMLDGKKAAAAQIEILDAFPIKPSLSVDIATPQWHWDDNGRNVKYQPEPHPLLSLLQPEFTIGAIATRRRCQNPENDLKTVKQWLENALLLGIGSRVSAGYGRAEFIQDIHSATIEQMPRSIPEFLHSESYGFELWTEGMRGVDAQGEAEFRPTAIRGMLRYWFRAIALALYPPSQCKELEGKIFGTIDPPAKEGKLSVAVSWQLEQKGSLDSPHYYTGSIHLESDCPNCLNLGKKLLELASHLGGIGRGSRRPLHWNDRMRGCHWQLNDVRLSCSQEEWRRLLREIRQAFETVEPQQRSPENLVSGNPVDGQHRYQDVLNQRAKIYLVPDLNLKSPDAVEAMQWIQEGVKDEVRGKALTILYKGIKETQFKGEAKKKLNGKEKWVGNKNVGGKLGLPSLVTIASNFPFQGSAYQAVIIFGYDYHEDRKTFARTLPKETICLPIPFQKKKNNARR